METKLKEQIINSEKLLSEISAIKELVRLNDLLESGINSTTLTIDEEYSEEIRFKSESYICKYLEENFGSEKVVWLNKNGESHSPHDFELLDENGKVRSIIECKGTPRLKPTYYLTKGEWAHFLENKSNYQVYRVFNVESDMYHVCIDNLYDWLSTGKVVPYLKSPEILKENRVFLTLV